ncbi:MAG: hypothetical protein LBS05_10225 [Tannerellaceae bacterium]|jgi:hypothetical protein|nr:hypothetical protein [Tannerellaceae bacterium]
MSRIFHYILFCVCILLGAGCVQEEVPVPVPPPSPETETITLYIKDASRAATRALSESDESVVEDLDVLVFKYKNGEARLYQHISVDRSLITSVSDDKKEFQITLPRDNDYYQFEIFANAKSEVAAYIQANGDPTGKLKSDILPEIVSVSSGVWNSGADYRKLHMWGKTEGSKTLTQLNTGATIKLFRSLVRVDVEVNVGVPFELKEIYVYNRPTRGRIAPDLTFWNGAQGQERFTAPSLPANLGLVPLDETVSRSKYTVTGGKSVREIYLYETEEKGTQNFMDATFLVLGGRYNGSSTTTYYRVNFADMLKLPEAPDYDNPNWWDTPPGQDTSTGESGMVGAGDSYHPLIRNHHYQMTITAANGAGFATPQKASESLSSQLSSIFIAWNNTDQQVVIDNTSYTFKVSPSVAEVNYPHGSQYIDFETTFPNPVWVLEGDPTVTWFHVSFHNGDIFVVPDANYPPVGTVGYFHLLLKDQGGNVKLTKQIKVVYIQQP